jgi:hypothetical protein
MTDDEERHLRMVSLQAFDVKQRVVDVFVERVDVKRNAFAFTVTS